MGVTGCGRPVLITCHSVLRMLIQLKLTFELFKASVAIQERMMATKQERIEGTNAVDTRKP